MTSSGYRWRKSLRATQCFWEQSSLNPATKPNGWLRWVGQSNKRELSPLLRRRREREESGFASAKIYIVGFDEVLFWELSEVISTIPKSGHEPFNSKIYILVEFLMLKNS